MTSSRCHSESVYYSYGNPLPMEFGMDEEVITEPVDSSRARDSILVTIRFRSLIERECHRGDEIAWYADGDKIVRNEYNPATAYAFDQYSPGIIPLAIKDVFSIIQEGILHNVVPVVLVDGYNVCGYWMKLKKDFVKGRLDIAHQKLIDELLSFSMLRVAALKEDGCPKVWVVTSNHYHQQAAHGVSFKSTNLQEIKHKLASLQARAVIIQQCNKSNLDEAEFSKFHYNVKCWDIVGITGYWVSRVFGCMALGPIVGDDGAKEKQRYTNCKVYTRKALKGSKKKGNTISTVNVVPPQQKPSSLGSESSFAQVTGNTTMDLVEKRLNELG
ncbi:hypothetical protein JHK86_055368 [Glycine max]|nr:hypothetical protein JHK86_055368 [Glycine max]